MANEQEPQGSTTESRVDRIRELNDRIVASARKRGDQSVETYERSLENLAKSVESAGDRSADWIQEYSRSQAAFLRKITEEFPDTLERIAGEVRHLVERAKTKARDVSGIGKSKESKGETEGPAT